MDLMPSIDIGWLNYLTNLFIEIGERYRYLNFFIGMFLESAGVPFASMPAFTSTSYLLAQGEFNFWWAVLIGGLGNTLGSSVSYGLGYFFGDVLKKRRSKKEIVEREGRLRNYIKRYGAKTIFVAQLLGPTRVFISFPAGILRMNFWKFTLATFAGGMIFVVYFAFGTTLLIDVYDRFVYPYIGLSFLSLGIIIGFGYALTGLSMRYGKRAHTKIKDRLYGHDSKDN